MAIRTTKYGDANSDLQDRNIGFGAAGRRESDPCKFRTYNARRVFFAALEAGIVAAMASISSGQLFSRVRLFFISFWARYREGVAASSRICHSPELSHFFVEDFKQWIPYRFTWFNWVAPFGIHLSLATTYSKFVSWFRPKTYEKNLAQPAAVLRNLNLGEGPRRTQFSRGSKSDSDLAVLAESNCSWLNV